MVTNEQVKTWLTDEVTIEAAEAKSLEDLESKNIPLKLPFGAFNLRWNEFKGKMLDGDKLYNFQGEGTIGLAIVRGIENKVVEVFHYVDVNAPKPELPDALK